MESLQSTSRTSQGQDRRSAQLDPALQAEERLVAELELLGVAYLTRQTSDRADATRPPERLLADLVQQPSARVRAAVIAVLLLHPGYARAMPGALARLPEGPRLTLRMFYTAARLLQRAHAADLQSIAPARRLPKRYAVDLGLLDAAPEEEQLAALAERHGRASKAALNRRGTYESVVRNMARSAEAARRWRW
jgi:hypothetical protein